ncbi:ABC transporter permease subunit [Deinococcus detaillensis]|uniref:Maltose/maltodextrin transport system permease protein n=1 Tax=Deinococcus detaillensis TaxID=2592048 RepID=A0A553V5A9_9DEIO|nr:ABC transporter permease subunit [Deinococcus detaillensis]TSA87647.1 ABC transporter permease subunit [Deinococcus detaillensis]
MIAIGILTVVMGGAALGAWLLSGAVAGIWPKAPPYLILVLFVPLLIALMLGALRMFRWMQSWYYIVPALVFLLAFTAVPIVLTVNYAFTNKSGVNSGAGDTALKTPVTLSTDRKTITFSGALPAGKVNLPTFLQCTEPTCTGESIVLYDEEGSVPVYYKIASISPPGAGPTSVTLLSSVAPSFIVTDATRLNRIRNVGLENFRQIFARASVELVPVFIWTITFAFLTVIINAVAGLILGILLYNPRLKGRNFYRTLLFLPWAIPAVITVQMWVALFNQQFGVVNKALGLLGFAAVPWLGDPLWAKVSVLVVNLWLGFPYMMTATISALATISDDLYEAASIDGASRWQQITGITLPLLRNSFTPILLSGFAFNFNNFGIIYLLTQGGPPVAGRTSTAGATDILLSWGYNTAFGASGGQNYSLASAIALIIFVLTLGISLINFKAAGVFEEARK